MFQIAESVNKTKAFHEQLVETCQQADLAELLGKAGSEMERRAIWLSAGHPMPMSLSAMLLTESDADTLRKFAVVLHGVAEKVLDRALESIEMARRYFPEAERMYPHLAKTRGVDTWQVFGRHDAAIDPEGRLSVLELNTARPGGLSVLDATTEITLGLYRELGLDKAGRFDVRGTIDTFAHVGRLLQIEVDAGIEPGAIGVLFDENHNQYELDLMIRQFEAHGREAILLDTADLELRDDRLYGDGRYLSSTHNRFRVSTPNSPYDCWKPGFEKRYASFLEAQKRQLVVSANNLGSHCFAGNKRLLELMHRDEFQESFTAEEREFVREHVPWTVRFEPGEVDWHGRTIDLVPYVRDHREQFVLKPTSQSSGHGVIVGKFAAQADWEKATIPSADLPYVVQDFVECLTLPVPHLVDGKPEVTEMFAVAGLAYVCGEYQGCISRISSSPVINVVAGRGYPHAVMLIR